MTEEGGTGNTGSGMGPGYSDSESGVPGGWGAEANSGSDSGGSGSSAPATTVTTSSDGTYTDAQGRPISREQAILSGQIDNPGTSQFERIQGLTPGSGPTPPPPQGPPPELKPRTTAQEIPIGVDALKLSEQQYSKVRGTWIKSEHGDIKRNGEYGYYSKEPPTDHEFAYGTQYDKFKQQQTPQPSLTVPSLWELLNPVGYGFHPDNPAGKDPYWAIHKEDAPRSDLPGQVFHGGSPLGKFLEAIQDPGLAYEYLKFDINTIMGKSPSDTGIQNARETFLETVNSRKENYGLSGAAAIGVAGSMPVQAYAGGALFKGGTIAAKVGLRTASGAVGSNIVARGLLFGEKAVEPLAIVGGLGLAGKELVTTYQNEGAAGAAAQATIMAGSLPFVIAGWKGTGDLYSKVTVKRPDEVLPPISPEVLSGKQQFPTTEPGTTQSEILAGFKTDEGLRAYHATSESMGKEVIVNNAPKRPSDVGGLYVSPHEYGTSPHFLRVKSEYSGGIKEILKGFLQSEPLNPTVMDIQLKGVGRLPKDIRYLPKDTMGRYSAAREFMGESAEPGKAYLTPKLENTLKAGGAAEAEAVISPGSKLTRTRSSEFFKQNGRYIRLDRYTATGEGEAVPKTNTPTADAADAGNYGYQRTTIPPVSSNIGLNIGPGAARAEPSQADYITAYNAAKDTAAQQPYSNDITAIHEPHSPGKVDTLRNKKQAEDLADKIIKDLQGGGMNVRYNRRTATIEKVPDSFDMNQGAEPILDIEYFNKPKDLRSTAFDKGFPSQDLTGMNTLSLDLRKTQQVGDLSILAKYYGNNPADVPLLFPDAEYGGRSENFNIELRNRKTRQARENMYRVNREPYTPPYRPDRTSGRTYTPPPYRPDYRPPVTPPYRPDRTSGRTYIPPSYRPGYRPPGTPPINIPTYPPRKKREDDDENIAEIKIDNKFFRTSRKSPIAAASTDLSGVRKAMGIAAPKTRRRRRKK